MTDESSTSVLLAVTRSELATARQALAASQADLTRVERERDEARHDLAHARFQLDIEAVKLANVRELWAESADQRDLALAALATATAELEQLRARLNPNPEET